MDIVKFSFPSGINVCRSGIFWFKNNFHIKGFRSRSTKAKNLTMQVPRLAESFGVFERELLGCQASLIWMKMVMMSQMENFSTNENQPHCIILKRSNFQPKGNLSWRKTSVRVGRFASEQFFSYASKRLRTRVSHNWRALHLDFQAWPLPLQVGPVSAQPEKNVSWIKICTSSSGWFLWQKISQNDASSITGP